MYICSSWNAQSRNYVDDTADIVRIHESLKLDTFAMKSEFAYVVSCTYKEVREWY